MGAADLLSRLRESGLYVSTQAGKLAVTPAGRITPDTRRLIRSNKSHLLNALDAEREELTRLVRLCGERYGFTETEHAEALEAATRDPENALACFRSMARDGAA